jgi:protein CpxP
MKNLMIFALLLLTATFVFAQDGNIDATKRIQKKIDRMTEKLNLSAEQQEQFKALYTEQQEARLATKKDKSEMTEEEKAQSKVERKAARKYFDTKLNGILTAEQQEIYKAGKQKSKAKGKQHKKGKNKSPEQKAERKVAKLTAQLNLNDSQQQQMMDLILDRAAQKNATGQAKKEATSKEDHEALKAERKVEKANHQAKFEAILTAEQLAIYKKKQEERKSEKKMK